MVWETEGPPALPNARKEAVKASHRSLVSAYHKLGDFPLLDAGGGDLEEQFDVLPATFWVRQYSCNSRVVMLEFELGLPWVSGDRST